MWNRKTAQNAQEVLGITLPSSFPVTLDMNEYVSEFTFVLGMVHNN